tara:strand:+ start:3158 stop:3682 length:525 start_codon:yes stop_codon:yes gene_type:complete
MKKKLTILFTFGFIILIFFVFFQGLFQSNTYVPKKIIEEKVDSFTANELYTNKELKLNDLLKKNKFTILNIWASWCLPCRTEHKYLMELSKNEKLNIIGINYKDKENNAKKFILKFGNPYSTILIDKEGIKSIELGAYGVPETYIINNSKKKIIKKYIGAIDENKLQEIIKIIK